MELEVGRQILARNLRDAQDFGQTLVAIEAIVADRQQQCDIRIVGTGSMALSRLTLPLGETCP